MPEQNANQQTAGVGASPGFESNLDRFDLDWSEDGEIELREKVQPQSQQQAQAGQSPQAGQQNQQPAGQQATASPELKALQDQNTMLKAQLETMSKMFQGQNQQQGQQQPQLKLEDLVPENQSFSDIWDDRKNGLALLQNAFNIMMRPLIETLRPMTSEWQVTQDVRRLNNLHGEEFRSRLPLIKELVQGRTDLTIAQAWEAVRNIPIPKSGQGGAGTNPLEAGTGSGNQQVQNQQQIPTQDNQALDALARLAKKLTTEAESGVASGKQEVGYARTIDEAVDRAIGKSIPL